MVVKPRELINLITDEEKPVIKRLEKRIDDCLTKDFRGTGSLAFGMNEDFKSLRPPTKEKLLDKYRQAGWNVKEISDQRDGDYVEFSYNSREERQDYWDYWGGR
jgi:hypothetical protein